LQFKAKGRINGKREGNENLGFRPWQWEWEEAAAIGWP